jgi:MraZ protein
VFQGASKLSLDNRGRMIVPTKHRDALNLQSEGRLTLTRHPDGCLLLFPRSVWEKSRAEIAGWPMSLKQWQRMFLGNASDIEMDNAGRVLISPELRAVAGLDLSSQVMLLGMGSHFEIWEAAAHEKNEATTAAAGFPEDLRHFSF